MKKFLVNLFLLVMLTFSSVVAAAPADIRNYPPIAVMPFGNKAIMSKGLMHHDMRVATEYAIYQLVNSGWFDVIDYESVGAALKLKQMDQSGFFDPATTSEIGKFVSAKYMFIGNVTGLTIKETGAEISKGSSGGIGFTKYTVTANVTLRAVDVNTMRIVAAGMGTDSSSSANLEIKFPFYRRKVTETRTQSDSIGKATNSSGNTSEGYDITMNNERTITNEEVESSYSIKIGAHEVSDVQARNAISKAVWEAIYGKTGIITQLNGGQRLKNIKKTF